MEIFKQSINNISIITGEFKDKALEHDFQSYNFQEFNVSSRKNILTFGILFFLFIVPDYFLIKDEFQLTTIFLIRVLYLLISILYYSHLPYLKLFPYFYSTAYELIGIICFWILFFCDKHPNIFFYQQGIIIFILAIFLILPNGFFNKIILSILLTFVSFYIITNIRKISSLPIYSGGMHTFALTIILFCILANRYTNRLQRMQFLDKQALERLSSIDSLTGALNRRKYDQDLGKEIARAQRYKLPLSGIMLDLDNFKEINDEHGHLAGDRILVRLCSHIRTLIRKIDQIYRWGGEEFIIILPNTRLEAAEQLANRIRNFLQKADFSPASKVACSFGVTSWNEYEIADSFTNRLDQLLYQAKRKGKGCIVSDITEKNLKLFGI